jgi:hypothetical protein
MENVKTTEIRVTEHYGDNCFNDSFQGNPDVSFERRPKGKVEIYEVGEGGKKRLIKKNNLVIYLGRETLAQMLVGKNDTSVPESNQNHYLNWFGLGDGGVLPADPFDPVPPANENDDLQSRVMINATDASSADYHLSSEAGYPKTGYYKHPFDSVVFERDTLNDDKWLVLKITTTIGVDDANDERLSEAGLFTSESDEGGWSGDFALFARVTFPTLIKDATRRLIFVWYLYV